MTSLNIGRIGAGEHLVQARLGADFASVLNRVLSDSACRDKARAFARKYSEYDQGRVIERMANSVERLPERVRNRVVNDAGSPAIFT
jgi:hypothetical protein